MAMAFQPALVIIIVVLVMFQNYGVCSRQMCQSSSSFHVKDGFTNRALDSRILKTTIINHDPECYIECRLDCRCLSFNVCGKQCQLNADSKNMTALKIKKGCTYYDVPIPEAEKTGFPRCCLTSTPCQNGGTCEAVPTLGRRFGCECRPGFYGLVCETSPYPQTCADFMSETVKPLSGEYQVVDKNGNPFPVYCDFDSEANFAWTLVLSFSRDQPSVSKAGLLADLPVNEDSLTWANYRLSFGRMNTIAERSTHWRATCAFDTVGVYYNEYIRVNLSMVDFFTYYFDPYNGPTACKTIEYMNFWGNECHNCNHALYYRSAHLAFLDLKISSSWSGCTFDLSNIAVECPDNQNSQYFADYTTCLDTRSLCQLTATSTTQNWFGEGPINRT